jgi:hypothetical protein
MRLLQFSWFTIERCSIVEPVGRAGVHLWGCVDHAYSVRYTREAARISVLGAGLLLASLASAAAQDPHAEIFTGLEASNNAISGYFGRGLRLRQGTLRAWLARPHGRRGGALCNDEYDSGRGGLFVKANLRNLELTLSGGFTGNYLEDEPSGYVSLAFRD